MTWRSSSNAKKTGTFLSFFHRKSRNEIEYYSLNVMSLKPLFKKNVLQSAFIQKQQSVKRTRCLQPKGMQFLNTNIPSNLLDWKSKVDLAIKLSSINRWNGPECPLALVSILENYSISNQSISPFRFQQNLTKFSFVSTRAKFIC